MVYLIHNQHLSFPKLDERKLLSEMLISPNLFLFLEPLSNSYTMACLPVLCDNPRALASGFSYVQVDKHGITILYHLHQCRTCTSRAISCLSW